MLYRTAAEVDAALEDLPVLPRPKRVLLTTPVHFEVAYVINPHMEGKEGMVDQAEAAHEWQTLREAYETLGYSVETVEGAEGLPDMVFCANQTLPYYEPVSGARGVVLSRMYAEQRRPEVPPYAHFFDGQGYDVEPLPDRPGLYFEGMGDGVWHPGHRLLWGGYGFRTDLNAYAEISDLLDVPVCTLRLTDPDFYHLDTCFSVLDERSVLIYPPAFDDDGLGLIHHFFETVIEAPDDEARELFACNAHCPDGEHVLIQRGCQITNRRLRQAGFTPVELDTGEFLKAGGSVFCMKLMYW